MTSKVIFTDYDGVFWPYRTILHHPANSNPKHSKLIDGKHLSYWKMDEVSVAMLLSLYEIYPFEIVVSSTWAELHTQPQLKTILQWNGIDLPFHKDWMTPRRFNNSNRANEILGWLADHPEIDDYIILDDFDSGIGLANAVRDGSLIDSRTFIMNPEVGITSSVYSKLEDIVQKWSSI